MGEADENRQDQAEQGTDGRARTFALLEHRQQEEHGFQAFAGHGEKHHGNQRPDLVPGAGECVVEGFMQGVLDGPGDLAHPEHHRAEDADGNQPDHAFEEFLLLLRELGTDQLQATTDQQGKGGGKEHADPHRGHPLTPASLLEVNWR